MKKIIIIFTVFMAIAGHSHAQTGCYESIRQEGLDSLNNGKFLDAMEKFELAFDCDDRPDTNDLRKWQDECRQGIRELISNQDTYITDLLLSLGNKELELGNYDSAIFFFRKTQKLATQNDVIRDLSENLITSWYSSSTKLWDTLDLRKSHAIHKDINSMPILNPPYEVINITRSGDIKIEGLKTGISGENIIFNRDINQIVEVISPDTVALWDNYVVNPDVIKIPFNDPIKQYYADKKGEYIAVSFSDNPLIKIYSLAEKSIVAEFKPKTEIPKRQPKTRQHKRDVKGYDEELYQYDDELYQYDQGYDQYGEVLNQYGQDPSQAETNRSSSENVPYVIIGTELFYLHVNDNILEIMDIKTKKIRQLELEFMINKMVSSPDEKYIVMYGESGALLFDVKSNISNTILSYGVRDGYCKFTADDNTMAVATANNSIDIYDTYDGIPYLINSNIFPGSITDFNFNPEGDKIVTLVNNQVIEVHEWSLWTNVSDKINIDIKDSITHTGMVGDFVYGLSDSCCFFWKLPLMFVKDEVAADDFDVELKNPYPNRFSASNNVIAIRSLASIIKKSRKDQLTVVKAGLSPDLEHVAVSSTGTYLYVYDALTSEEFRKFRVGSLVNDFCFTGNNKIAVFCDNDTIFIFDLYKDQPEKVFVHKGETISDFQPSNTGDFLSVTLSSGEVIIYSLASNDEIIRIKPETDSYNEPILPYKGRFSTGDKYYSWLGTDGLVRNWDLTTRIKNDSLYNHDYDFTSTLCWENDSVYLAAGMYYGRIDRFSASTGLMNSITVDAENPISEIISIPEKKLIITTTSNGFLNFYDNIKGFRLGLPYIFEGAPKVIAYNAASEECMVYVRGDGFYRIQTLSSRSAEKIPVQLTDTTMNVNYPDLLGSWSSIFKNPDGTTMTDVLVFEKGKDSVYYGNFSWWYESENATGEDSTNAIEWSHEPTKYIYDPYSRLLKVEFTGESNEFSRLNFRAYVSEDGNSLYFGTVESYDSPGEVMLKWSGTRQENPDLGQSKQAESKQEEKQSR